MHLRELGPFKVSPVGLGCMSMSHGYGVPDDTESERCLLRALDMGYSHLDTAAFYGFGKNEELIGRVLKSRRSEYVLASKCGMFKDASGKRAIDGRPEILKKTCEDSLRRLNTDVIDLYYLHRVDKKVPMEDSVGALSELVNQGKVRAIGLSEVSARTLKKANRIHPISAVQTEYSLWTRNAEIKILDTCKELGVSFVAFSPLGRGFLTGILNDVDQLVDGDIRLGMPRFNKPNFEKNINLLKEYSRIAHQNNCTMAQLALAWLLKKGDHIVPIPGTRHSQFAEENIAAAQIDISPQTISKLDHLINQDTVSGDRYPPATSSEIDTENF